MAGAGKDGRQCRAVLLIMTFVQQEFIQEVNACPDLTLIAVVSGFALIRTKENSLAILTLPRTWTDWTRRGKILRVLSEVFDRVNRTGRFYSDPERQQRKLKGLKTPAEIFAKWEETERQPLCDDPARPPDG